MPYYINMKSKIPLIFYICIVLCYCWCVDLAKFAFDMYWFCITNKHHPAEHHWTATEEGRVLHRLLSPVMLHPRGPGRGSTPAGGGAPAEGGAGQEEAGPRHGPDEGHAAELHPPEPGVLWADGGGRQAGEDGLHLQHGSGVGLLLFILSPWRQFLRRVWRDPSWENI